MHIIKFNLIYMTCPNDDLSYAGTECLSSGKKVYVDFNFFMTK